MAVPGDSFASPQDQLRASDAERDLVISELGDRFAAGRISHDTFAARVDAALHARGRGELRNLLADLPRSRHLGAAVWAAAQDPGAGPSTRSITGRASRRFR
jgi:hypothetical protein